jgi:hypothetical protein
VFMIERSFHNAQTDFTEAVSLILYSPFDLTAVDPIDSVRE